MPAYSETFAHACMSLTTAKDAPAHLDLPHHPSNHALHELGRTEPGPRSDGARSGRAALLYAFPRAHVEVATTPPPTSCHMAVFLEAERQKPAFELARLRLISGRASLASASVSIVRIAAALATCE